MKEENEIKSELTEDEILAKRIGRREKRRRLKENQKTRKANIIQSGDSVASQSKTSKKRNCKICSKSKHRVCLEHHNFSNKVITRLFFEMVRRKIRSKFKRFYFRTARKLGFVD